MAAPTAVGLIVLAEIAVLLSHVLAGLPVLHHPVKSDGSLSVLVIGDWGRRGTFNQSTVADQLGRTGEDLSVDFVVSTGDNFYDNGLTGVEDAAFIESFSGVYTAQSLRKPWYSVLGNHDYRGDVLSQLSPLLREIDGRWTCMRSFVVDAETAQFFFVDTTPFVESYWTNPDGVPHDSRGISPRENYIATTLKDLEDALTSSHATWKFVIGHHAIRSVSIHGDTPELVNHLLPILKAHDVDLYINGHDHCLEHISSNDNPIQFLTSGGGSKAWRGVYTPNEDKLRFFYDGQGFMSMELTQDRLEVSFYSITGEILHRWIATKDIYSI
ncbi:purple acid phosphatase 4-like [Wolffia australiana]